jgi:polar amino acid transport system substrate-binding protein
MPTKPFRHLLFAITLVSSALSFAPSIAKADMLDDIMKRGTIRVGTLVDLPPFGMTDKDQNPIGFDVELANMLAKDLGVKLELVPVSGGNRLPYLVTNKVDIIVGAFGATPERARQISFSSAYASNYVAVYGNTDKQVKAPEDLGDLKVGVARGTSEDISLTALAPKAKIVRYEDQATAVAAFLSGQVDLLGCPNLVFNRVAENNKNRPMDMKFNIRFVTNHIGLKRNEPELLRWLDTFVFYHKITGDLDMLHRKWLNEKMPNLPSM